MDSTINPLDPLDREIASVEADLEAKGRELEMLRVKAQALRLAASLRPLSVPIGATALPLGALNHAFALGKASGLRGKAVGTINTSWRNTLARAVSSGNEFLTPDLWVLLASEAGFDLTVTAAQDWLTRGGGAKNGLVERAGDGFRVSAAAIERFGLKAAEPPLEVTSDGSG